MKRETYRYDKDKGKLVRVALYAPSAKKQSGTQLMVDRDFGHKQFNNKQQRKEYMKRNGLVEIGDVRVPGDKDFETSKGDYYRKHAEAQDRAFDMPHKNVHPGKSGWK